MTFRELPDDSFPRRLISDELFERMVTAAGCAVLDKVADAANRHQSLKLHRAEVRILAHVLSTMAEEHALARMEVDLKRDEPT